MCTNKCIINRQYIVRVPSSQRLFVDYAYAFTPDFFKLLFIRNSNNGLHCWITLCLSQV